MQLRKKFLSLMILLLTLFLLSACGTSLEKPSGLENNENQHIDVYENDSPGQADGIDVADREKNDANNNMVEDESERKDNEEDKTQLDKNTDNKTVHHRHHNESSSTHHNQHHSDKINDKQQDRHHNSMMKKHHQKSKSDTKSKPKSNSNSNSSSKKPSENHHSNHHETKKPNKDTNQSEQKEPSTTETKKPTPSQDKPKEEKPVVEQSKNTITHSIVISKETNEIPLAPIEQEINDGDTVLDALIAVTQAYKIQMDYRGGRGATAYVEGIDNVYEFDRGQGSGWMFRINGKFPDRGAGAITLCSGDRLEWLYTTNLGADLGADLEPLERDGTCPK